jgi:hypothetical protein
VIQIDAHPIRENPTNTSHASHAQSAYGPTPYISHVVNTEQPFVKSSRAMDRVTAPNKKGSRHNSQHDSRPIYGSIPSFSPELAISVVGVKPPSVDIRLLGLPGP